MQTPKANRIGSLEVPQRKSPATPRTTHQLKKPGSEPDSVSSPNVATRTPKNRSPKVIERRSPRSPVAEKKQPKRVSDLESQLTQLQEDLKRTKDQLNSSESLKRRFQQEAEEAKNQILDLSAKLEDSQQNCRNFLLLKMLECKSFVNFLRIGIEHGSLNLRPSRSSVQWIPLPWLLP